MRIDKTDIQVIEHMLADRVMVPVRRRIEATVRDIVRQFVTSNPKPGPHQTAKILLETEIKMEVIYGILDKIIEYKHGSKHLKKLQKKDERLGPGKFIS